MDHRVPKVGAAISVVLAILAAITFLYLNNKFEGPDPLAVISSPNQMTAKFENTKKLPTKQPVLHKGITIGTVNEVKWDPVEQVGVVTFTIDEDFPIYQDAVLQIGERSLLGDPYLNLVSRGTDLQPELEAGDAVVNTKSSVNFDEALAFLDEEGRADVKSLIKTISDGASPQGNGERLNGTVGGLARTVQEAYALTRAVEGQEEQIADLVSNASVVLSEIGNRERAVRTIVGSGRATLDALASNTASLDQALVELPRLLDSGTRSLAAAEPLFAELRPLAAKLRILSPDLATALDPRAPHSLAEISEDLARTVEALTPLREAAVPVLGDLLGLLEELQPLVKVIGPAAQQLVPALDYLTPRVEAIAGLYALVAATAKGSDSERGHYLRASFQFDEAEITDMPEPANCDPATQNDFPNQGHCQNAYPKPGDAANPQPFQGRYPKIIPCEVPSRKTPKRPCK
ncbi:MAG: MlaD family protein [Actinomycetota bacterium]|nr:MlaD family protein [Actinomycetota bacterium]